MFILAGMDVNVLAVRDTPTAAISFSQSYVNGRQEGFLPVDSPGVTGIRCNIKMTCEQVLFKIRHTGRQHPSRTTGDSDSGDQEKTIVCKNLRRATMPFDKEKQVTLIFQGCQTAR